MGLEVGGGTKKKKEEEEEKEKIPLCESIGHRPLRGRCPKAGKNGKKNKKTMQESMGVRGGTSGTSADVPVCRTYTPVGLKPM